MRNKGRLIVLGFVFITFCGCKKECDFHEQFLGEFRFTVLTEHWGGLGNYTDTTIFDGVIRRYEAGDEYLDESVENQNSSVVNDGKLMIAFLNQRFLLSGVNKDGSLEAESGYHYHHEGKFNHSDKIQFQITGLGGLGAGWNYFVTGERIQ
jgi:hypothetical protein